MVLEKNSIKNEIKIKIKIERRANSIATETGENMPTLRRAYTYAGLISPLGFREIRVELHITEPLAHPQ